MVAGMPRENLLAKTHQAPNLVITALAIAERPGTIPPA